MCLDQAGLVVSVRLAKSRVEGSLTVCAVPALGKRLVVIGGSMSVHELPSVVCIVARILQPDWQVFIVPSFGDEFWITTFEIHSYQ